MVSFPWGRISTCSTKHRPLYTYWRTTSENKVRAAVKRLQGTELLTCNERQLVRQWQFKKNGTCVFILGYFICSMKLSAIWRATCFSSAFAPFPSQSRSHVSTGSSVYIHHTARSQWPLILLVSVGEAVRFEMTEHACTHIILKLNKSEIQLIMSPLCPSYLYTTSISFLDAGSSFTLLPVKNCHFSFFCYCHAH